MSKKSLRTWVLSSLLVLPVMAEAALVWRPGEGWVNEGSGEALAASDARAQLQVARDFESKEDWSDALKAYSGLVRRWPLSSVAAEAQFKIALMQEKMADFWRAYEAYQKLVTKYAGSPFFDLAIERQYNIGNLYLSGERQRIWKIPTMPSMDKTVEIYQTVIKNAPYGKFAPAAQFNIGRAREKQKNWQAAISAYVALIDKYPRSDLADDAQYQMGYAWYKASSDADYDQSAAEKSTDAFNEFLIRYPNHEKAEQARQYIVEMGGRRLQGAMNIAKFYENQKDFKAAIVYYNEVIQQDPSSEQAEFAKRKLDELKPIVEQEDGDEKGTEAAPSGPAEEGVPMPDSPPVASHPN